jgi:putative toxin of predicted polymorphic toxin system
MTLARQVRQYAGGKLSRRLVRTMPWLGAIVAVATFGSAIRRKGWLGGTIDTALDFTPYVGGVKNLVEARRGRDFIPDKRPVARRPFG